MCWRACLGGCWRMGMIVSHPSARNFTLLSIGKCPFAVGERGEHAAQGHGDTSALT